MVLPKHIRHLYLGVCALALPLPGTLCSKPSACLAFLFLSNIFKRHLTRVLLSDHLCKVVVPSYLFSSLVFLYSTYHPNTLYLHLCVGLFVIPRCPCSVKPMDSREFICFLPHPKSVTVSGTERTFDRYLSKRARFL